MSSLLFFTNLISAIPPPPQKSLNFSQIIERVKIRVFEGGHDINPDVIERRYIRGIKNLFDIYLPIVDGALIFDNSEGKHELIVEKQIDGLLNIVNEKKFNLLKNQYDNS